MIFSSQSSSEGRLRGRGGGARTRLATTLTNRVMSGPDGSPENGSFDVSLMMSRAGQIMISHLNGSFRANAARRTDSLTSFAHHKGADGANVDDVEPGELLGDECRLASIGSTDVYRAKKYDRGHQKKVGSRN